MVKRVVKTLHGVRFEWDETKAAANPLKHDGVTFDEATEVFSMWARAGSMPAAMTRAVWA